ncbi:hypothetical protein MARTH_orf278 [Metamycoplasma arthritidis 158L3-1]|uniref:Uncharacterized protein n=2 Tax=Metamycoplasma arthritidis TaxID=2111 RepID=B3PMC5_META1|nr:hypothetical protein MARTH_orf278 [Metamycoplasma arthritidis 158L3-1]
MSEEFVTVNAKMNFAFKVAKEAIVETIEKTFDELEGVVLAAPIELIINADRSNFDLNIKYKVNHLNNFVFETKKMIFLLEQKIFSLINKKPSNINLVFDGIINEI